jgi:predicted secreted protein
MANDWKGPATSKIARPIRKRNNWHIAALLALLFMSMPIRTASEPTSIPVELSSDDDGKSIKLVSGQLLIVRLPAQPGAGYSWIPAKSIESLALVKNEFVGKVLPGGQQLQVLEFEARAPERGQLILGYRRPWEKVETSSRHFSLSVTIEQN